MSKSLEFRDRDGAVGLPALPFFAGDIAGILAGVAGALWWRSGLCLDRAGLIACLAGCRCCAGEAVSKRSGIAVFAAILNCAGMVTKGNPGAARDWPVWGIDLGFAVFAALAVFVAGDVAGGAADGWERAVETAASARQAIGACGRHNVRPMPGSHLRGLEPGEGVAVVIIADRIAVFAADLYGDGDGGSMGLGCITRRAALPFLPKTLPIFLPDVLPEVLPLAVRVW